MPTSTIKLTMLNPMAGANIAEAIDTMDKWGVRVLDLKNRIFDKAIEEISADEAQQVAALATARGMTTNTLSTEIFGGDIETGEAAFHERYDARLDNTLAAAKVLQPQYIRLLAGQSPKRAEIAHSPDYIARHHPWLVAMYRDAIDRIAEAGLHTVIENEVGRCILANPKEILDFFDLIDRSGRVSLTWDIQNLWQMGCFPSLDIYRTLKPILAMIHLKGGRAETPGGVLKWKANLEDASWPVLEIVRAAIDDDASPVICLNPSHGAAPEIYDPDPTKDLAFLRNNFKEIE